MSLKSLILLCAIVFSKGSHLQCRQCTPGEYCWQDMKFLCPLHSTSVAGSDNITNCVCADGYHADANHNCIECEAGSYCTGDLQHACPPNSTSVSLSSQLNDCVCVPGHEGAECTPCAPGYYKDTTGVLACTACAVNTFSSDFGSTSCTACGSNEIAAAGASVCSCAAGYERIEGVCMLLCEEHSTRNADTHVCECNPGHFKHNSTCAHTCAPGTFKAVYGDEACTPCSENTYQHQSAATSCINCMANAYSDIGSTSLADCLCTPEYTLTDGACNQCDAGLVKDWTGNEPCAPCGPGTYRHESQDALFCRNCSASTFQPLSAQTACLPCQDNSVSDEGQSLCLCNAGYEWQQVSDTLYTCSACLKGEYKSSISNADCVPCLSVFVTTNVASTNHTDCTPCYGYITTQADGRYCNSCPSNSQYSLGGTSVSTCRCLAGYAGSYDSASDSLTCTACENGKYKSSVNNNLCTSCPAGNIGIEGTVTRDELSSSCVPCPTNEYRSSLTECTACPENSTSPAGSDDVSACLCAAGYELDGSNCVPCADGFVKPLVGNHACTACAAGKYTVAETCVDCPAFATSPEASSTIGSCQCTPGYTGADGSACTACAPGTYKVSVGSDSCDECTPGTYQYDTPPFTTYACEQCPENTTSPSGSYSISACQCRAGYLMSEDSSVLTCHPCPAGSYCTDKVTQLPCSTGATSPLASDHAHDCTCVPGYVGVNNSCSRCPVNYYCEGGQHVQQCHDNSSTLTLAGTTNVSACVCDPGFFEEDYPVTKAQYDGILANFQTHNFDSNNWQIADNGGFTVIMTANYVEQTTLEWRSLFNAGKDGQGFNLYQQNSYQQLRLEMYGEGGLMCLNTRWSSQNDFGPYTHQFNGDDVIVARWSERDKTATISVNGNTRGKICPDVNISNWEGIVSSSASSTGDFIVQDVLAYDTYLTDDIIDLILNHNSPPCLVCPIDSWCYHNAENECPGNSSSLAQTSTVAKCFCDEYFTKDAAGQCHLCGSHLVCHASDMVTEGVVEQCVQHSSNQHQSCVCEDGYYCRDGSTNTSCSDLYQGSCSFCPVGSFCQGNLKTACSVNETSTAGSSTIATCTCKPGYYRSGSLCLLCEKDSFCPGLQDETKYECSSYDPELITLQAGSHAREQCLCKDGFFRTDPTDLCKICPFDYYCVSEAISLLPNVDACIPNAYTLTRGVADRAGCICDAGFVLSNDAGTAECLPCEEGQRCGGGEVLDALCGANNRVANEDHSACICLPGYEQNADGFCEPCVAPYYKAVPGDFACTLCPDTASYHNSTYCVNCLENEERSADGLSCSCVAPLVRPEYGYDCAPCSADTYHDAGACVACTAHSTTQGVIGATTSTACVCDPGYIADEGLCVACSSGTYEKNGVCVSCGVGAVSPEASYSSTQCGCAAGSCQSYLWNHTCFGECEPTLEACTECQLGFFKDFVSAVGNTDTCGRCHLHTFANETGQVACHACPDNSVTTDLGADSVSDCVCDKGNEEIQSTSVQCPPTFVCRCNPVDPNCYLDESTACTTHILKRYSGKIRHVDQTWSTTYDLDFIVGCPVTLDWSLSDLPIYLGPATVYASFNLYDATDRWQDGIIRDFVTVDMDAKTTTVLVPDEARVYGFHGGYNPLNNDVIIWSKRILRMYLDGWSNYVSLRPSCPMGLFVDYTYDERHCKHEWPIVTTVTVCEHCNTGYAKNTIGNHQCTPCSKGFYADVEESFTCQECTRFNNDTTVAEAATNETLCVCSQGFYLKDDTACIPCIDGAYKSDDGNHLCNLCGVTPIHSYSTHDDVGAVTQSVCTSCPDNSGQDQSAVTFANPMDDVSDCLCFPGFTYNDGCEQCEEYKFKLGFSNDACAYCADGYFFVGHAQACAQCSLQDASDASRHHVGHAYNSLLNETSWGVDESDCTCDLGFIRLADTCVGCSPGTFRADHSILTCSSCELNTYQNQAAQTGCLACPPNSYTNITGASSISQCYCDAGFQMNTDTYICEQCDAGKFKGPGPQSCSTCPAGTYSLQGAAECTPCAATETSAAGSPAESHCVCLPGFGGAGCEPCQPGFYAAQGTLEEPDLECQACPANKTSPVQATSQAQCVCEAGHEVDPSAPSTEACQPCPDGQYAVGGTNEFCHLCGFGTVSEPAAAATSIDACQCDVSLGFL